MLCSIFMGGKLINTNKCYVSEKIGSQKHDKLPAESVNLNVFSNFECL